MQMETYEETNTLSLTGEESIEFKKITGELGLLKQAALVGENSVNPFRTMSESEKRVYQEILTESSRVEDFDSEAIPVRVLKLIQFVTVRGWFKNLRIWHSRHVKDPVLVGHTGDTYNTPPHMIARWGEVLLDFPTLRQMAFERRIEKLRIEREKALLVIRQDAESYLNGHGY